LNPVFRPSRKAGRSERTVKSLGYPPVPVHSGPKSSPRPRQNRNQGYSQMIRLSLCRQRRTKNQTGSGLFHPIVKEQVIPGQLEGLQTNPNLIDSPLLCQAFFLAILAALPPPPC